LSEQVALAKRSNGGWTLIVFVISIILNLCVAVSTLWVKAGYVAKPEFDAYKAEQLTKRESTSEDLKNIAIALAKITEQMKENDRQDQRLDKLEERMARQEQKR
jgi:hypothetical protein